MTYRTTDGALVVSAGGPDKAMLKLLEILTTNFSEAEPANGEKSKQSDEPETR